MFGSFKKKLKDAIGKISGKIEKDDHVVLEEKDFKEEPIQEPEKQEDILKSDIEEKHDIEEEHEAPDVLIETEEEWKKQEEESDKKIVSEINQEIEKLDEIEKQLHEEMKEEKQKDVVEQDNILIEEIEEQREKLEKVKEETLKEDVEEVKEDKVIQEIAETLEEKSMEELEEKSVYEKELKEETVDEIKLDDILKAEEEHKKTLEEKEKEIFLEAEKKPKIIIEERLPEIEISLEKEDVEEIKKQLEAPKIEPEIVVQKGEEKEGFSLFKKISEKQLSEDEVKEVLSDIKNVLLENDVALEVTEKICTDVKHNLVGKTIKRGKTTEVIESALRDAMFDVLNQEKIDLQDVIEKRKEPLLVMVLGFNGVGKTTTVARLAHKYKKFKPVIAAGDTFRAASIEQLEEHGKNLSVDIVKHRYGADSAAVIFDAKKHAIAKGSKLVLADTAGRAHTNANLMDELKKVCRVNKPDLKILVLDALAGNDIYEQARLFNEAVGVDAIILTKTDVYEKGGAALSAAYTIKKPILFLGSGQNYNDLKEFNPEDIVKNLLG